MNIYFYSTHEYLFYSTREFFFYSTHEFLFYSTHEFSFIIFLIFQIGMRPNQLPYKVNYMDSIQHMYIIATINNKPSSKVHHTTA